MKTARMQTLLLCMLVCLSLLYATTATAQGSLRAGAARVDITPPADPKNPPSGKYAHERLYVRAIVLDNGSTRAALIAADQGGLPDAVWQPASKQIAAELNCPIEDI
jgi:neutral ceramidase